MPRHRSSLMDIEPLKTELIDNVIIVSDDLRISFRRTIRVPDNGQQISFLPPDLGAFPLKAVSKYAGEMSAEMAAKGGVFMPMYRKWISWG
jgi:hypothetical protein